VGLQGGEQEVEVGGIGQQVLVHPLIVRHLAIGLEPDVAQRLVHVGADRVDQGHRANFDGLLAHDLVAQGGRDLLLVGRTSSSSLLSCSGRDPAGMAIWCSKPSASTWKEA
jgi:hypothetical protein